MSALWQALDEIDGFYGPDDGDTDEQLAHRTPVVMLRPTPHLRRPSAPANPDALNDAPSNVALTDKAHAALHPCPIRAHERQMAMVAAGDPQAVAIAEACRRWQAAQEATK